MRISDWSSDVCSSDLFDDALLEKFFDNPDTITPGELNEAVRKATIALKITPMMCGSSFKNKGVQTMLDAVCKFLPAPSDVPAVQGTNPDTGNEETRRSEERRVGQECGGTCRSWWAPLHTKKKKK